MASPKKDALIKKAIDDPLNFEVKDFDELVKLEGEEALTFDDIRGMIRSIYDMNESKLREASDATVGMLGKLNRRDAALRMKEFNSRIKRFNDEKRTQRSIVAEGDSWFMFPLFVTDIIDWLNRFLKDEYAVYSLAYGGDWITNIIYEGTYVEELSTLSPEYFLISGGGNDLVGNNKLAVMVDKNCGIKYPPGKERDYAGAGKYITTAFFAFINTLKLQYYLMFKSIHDARKLEQTKIITQGYGYAVPSFARHFSFGNILQWFVNHFIDTGKWLKRPLCIKGIPDEHHNNIVKLMIDEVNVMFIELANRPEFPRLYHIDCRPATVNEDVWYDELHLKSHVYEKVALTYKRFMDDTEKKEKVIIVQ